MLALAIGDQLRELGWEVHEVASQDGDIVAAIERHGTDVLLLDIDLAEELRGLAKIARLAAKARPGLVVLSAYSDDETLARAAALDADAYLIKPFDERLLRANVELAFQRRQNHACRRAHETAERQLAAFLDHSQDAIVGIDDLGSIILFNRQAEKIFGWTAEEAFGKPLDFLIPAEVRARHSVHVDEFAAGANTGRAADDRPPLLGLRKNGETFAVEISLAKVNVHGDTWLTAHIRDVSSHRRLEALVLESKRMEAVARVSLSVAHDFNSLLSAIGCSAFLLSELCQDERGVATAQDIHDAVERGGALTRMILGYARHGGGTKTPTRLDVHLDDLRGLLRVLAGPGAALTIDAQEGLAVEADASRLEQVFMNLVSNARDATDGRGRIAVRALRIDLEQPQEVRTGLLAAGSYVVLVVEDDDKGIPHDLASRIFEPFVSGRSDGRGTGLGLSTVRDVAVELGGHVDFLTSSSGTSFRVWLPRYGGAAPPRPPPSPALEPVRGARIILVEDDDGLASSLTEILRRAGYEVVTFRSAEDALAWTPDRVAHLLIADTSLPGKGGIALADDIVARCGVPVLILSGLAPHLDKTRYAGLSKPFTVKELLRRVALQIQAR